MKKTKTLASQGMGTRNVLVILTTFVLFGFTLSCSHHDKKQIANYAWERAEYAEFNAMRYGNRWAIVEYAWNEAAETARKVANDTVTGRD